MGVADVLAVRARTDLEGIAHHRAICRAHIAEALATVTVPFQVGTVTVTSVVEQQQPGGMWCLRVDGTGGGISWPVLVEQPAILVGDPAGGWLHRVVEHPDGRQVAELVELPEQAVGPPDRVIMSERLRYDPPAGLRSLLAHLAGEE